tara:strand:+ start:91143 stop:91841 length:699 start_codon:yes stop_codon:yes gene_type:complete
MGKLKFTIVFLLSFFTSKLCYSQDWPNLKRFQEANAQLSFPEPGKDRIVFMGNSITEGWSNHHPEFFTNRPYVNRGIGGQTTPQMLLRFKQDVIDLKPSVVVILAGINDIAGNTGPSTLEMIADNIFSMAELAKVHNIKVVLCSVLPAFDFPWRKGMEPAEKVVTLNAMIASYAKKHDTVYVDYFSAMVNSQKGLKDELGSDGIHPNAAGYAIMEPLVENGIARALNQKQKP